MIDYSANGAYQVFFRLIMSKTIKRSSLVQIDPQMNQISMPQIEQPAPLNTDSHRTEVADKLKEQLFDQMMMQSMNEMQQRQAEIKESLEKMNDDA
mgnify:FL=1